MTTARKWDNQCHSAWMRKQRNMCSSTKGVDGAQRQPLSLASSKSEVWFAAGKHTVHERHLGKWALLSLIRCCVQREPVPSLCSSVQRLQFADLSPPAITSQKVHLKFKHWYFHGEVANVHGLFSKVRTQSYLENQPRHMYACRISNSNHTTTWTVRKVRRWTQ